MVKEPKKKISPKTPASEKRSVSEKKPASERKKEPRIKKSLPEVSVEIQKSVAPEKISTSETRESVDFELKLDRDTKRPDRYFEAVGRRKTAVARVRLFTKPGDFTVNEKLYSNYFPTLELQKIAEEALQKMKLFGRFRVSVKTSGGGSHAQAEATRHGLSRCLIKFNADFRKRLKRAGYLKRDPRMKERKKPGLKRARRAPQWAKR